MRGSCGPWPFLIALSALLVSSGCYTVSGMVDVTSREKTEIIDTYVEGGDTPLESRREASATVGADSVVIEVLDVGWCRETIVELQRTTQYEERDLPGSHWIVFGSGIAALGGGLAMVGLGASGISDGESFSVGTPSQEEAYDRSQILLGVGIGTAVFGSALLASDIADQVLSIDGESDPVDVEREKAGELRDCLREPVVSAPIVIETEQGTAHIRTGPDGKRELRFDQEPLATLSAGASTLTVTCEECPPTTVSLVDDP